jgi:predicted Zn-dependent protease with MMP-like domain
MSDEPTSKGAGPEETGLHDHESSDAERSWDEEYGEHPEEEEGPEEAALERAWNLLDAGEAQKALDELLQLDADWPERWIPEALARTQLGELAAARRLLARTSELAEMEDHPDYLWAKVELDLAEWRIDHARTNLEKLLEVEKSPAALGRLALCAELDGDFENADAILQVALALEPDAVAIPRLSTDEFEEVVAEAVESLNPETKKALERCEIAIEPVPAVWMVDTSDPSETPPDMLGLFAGESELERSDYDTGRLPPRIFLFQRNLERACRTHAELVEQIRVTLFHEVGHMLGFDEHGVAELGLE